MSGVRKVVSLRLSETELAQVDALVEDARQRDKRNWWEPDPTRASVIREAIADRHTVLEQRNTRDAGARNTSARGKRNTGRARR
jgi:hypothetical protein